MMNVPYAFAKSNTVRALAVPFQILALTISQLAGEEADNFVGLHLDSVTDADEEHLLKGAAASLYSGTLNYFLLLCAI